MPVIVTPKPPAADRASEAGRDPIEEPSRQPSKAPIAATSTAAETAVAVETVAPPGSAGRRDGPRKIHRSRHGDWQSAGRRRRSEDRPIARRSTAPATGERARPAVKLAPMPKTSQPMRAAGRRRAARPEARPATAGRRSRRRQARQQSRWPPICVVTNARWKKRRSNAG